MVMFELCDMQAANGGSDFHHMKDAEFDLQVVHADIDLAVGTGPVMRQQQRLRRCCLAPVHTKRSEADA